VFTTHRLATLSRRSAAANIWRIKSLSRRTDSTPHLELHCLDCITQAQSQLLLSPACTSMHPAGLPLEKVLGTWRNMYMQLQGYLQLQLECTFPKYLPVVPFPTSSTRAHAAAAEAWARVIG
jgi:hypothetical protein